MAFLAWLRGLRHRTHKVRVPASILARRAH